MRYFVTTETIPTQPGCWDKLLVSVHQEDDDGVDTIVGTYKRNYSCLYNTFHPFQKGDKWYALYSKDYQTTSVMELPSCKHLADGPEAFCPVDFYVPQGRDLNMDGSLPEYEKNAGTFGFVSGCIWGDDSGGWKAEFLDLSKIEEGVLVQDGRLGYFELPGYKDLKDCFDVGWYGEDGRIRISMSFSCSSKMKRYIPDHVEYGRVGDPDPRPEEIWAMEEIPNKVLYQKCESVKDSYQRQDTCYHNLKNAIRRKYGNEVAEELDKEAKPFWKIEPPPEIQVILDNPSQETTKYVRCNDCDKTTPVNLLKEYLHKMFQGGRVLYGCPHCSKTVISKIHE